jgi:hypothetical protein
MLFLLFLLIPGVIHGATHYISTTGTDSYDCSGGTEEAPWKTWAGPQNRGCINSGDTVYFKAGTYKQSTFNNAAWRILGESGANITVAPDPAASGEWPVKITGTTSVFGKYAVIDGIEFDGTSNTDTLKNFASYITYQNNYFHDASTDCLRNSAVQYPGRKHNTNTNYIGNIISDCGQDAIDNTGAKNVVIRGNNIFRHKGMQIKGGTENILIEENTIHDSGSLFSGNNMNCSYYCGSPALLELPCQSVL